MAAILAVAFSPIASRLEPFVGTVRQRGLMVLVAVSAIGVTGYFLMVEELTSVAVEVAGYSDNIATKLVALEGSTPPWLPGASKAASRTFENSCKIILRTKRTHTPGDASPAGAAWGEGCSPARFANTLRHWREPVDHRPVSFSASRAKRLTRPFGKTRGPEPRITGTQPDGD